jgi:hypothetical protein
MTYHRIFTGIFLLFVTYACPHLRSEKAASLLPRVSTANQDWDAHSLSYTAQGMTLLTDPEAEPTLIPSEQLRCLSFPPAKEKVIARMTGAQLAPREKSGKVFDAYPEKILLEIEIPAQPELYITPFAVGMGDARKNTFRMWAGKTYVDVQGRGDGKTAMTGMENFRKNIPNGPGANTLLQFYFNRKEETCTLRINRSFVHTWKMPTSFEENPVPDPAIWFRAGLAKQTIHRLNVYTWTQNQNPQADLSPLADKEKIWLQNGDVLEAELLKIDGEKARVRLEPEVEFDLPLERILEIHFRKNS